MSEFKPHMVTHSRKPPVKKAPPIKLNSMEKFIDDLKKINDFCSNKGTQYTRDQLVDILTEMRVLIKYVTPVNYDVIDDTQKQTLGLLIIAAKDCQELLTKISLVREAAGTLRANVTTCGGPDAENIIKRIDSDNILLVDALQEFANSEGESTASLWSTTHMVLDNVYFNASKGYMIIKTEGVRFNAPIQTSDNGTVKR